MLTGCVRCGSGGYNVSKFKVLLLGLFLVWARFVSHSHIHVSRYIWRKKIGRPTAPRFAHWRVREAAPTAMPLPTEAKVQRGLLWPYVGEACACHGACPSSMVELTADDHLTVDGVVQP